MVLGWHSIGQKVYGTVPGVVVVGGGCFLLTEYLLEVTVLPQENRGCCVPWAFN